MYIGLITKKHSKFRVFFATMLIMFVAFAVRAQNPIQKDTLYMDDTSFEEIIYYNATDSIYSDLRKKQIHLVKDAVLIYGAVTMKADYILIDLNKNEVLATYLVDSLGQKTGKPSFEDGEEKMTASTIRYNFDTKKGFIEEVQTQQDENFLYMEVAKRHSNEEIHFKNGRFTTCDLEDPHFHFRLSKAILIPNKRIVSGPINLWVKGIPTPLGLPFAIIPQSRDRLSGFIFPQIIPSSIYGFGVERLGYYVPINDHFQTTLYGSLYSRGTFRIGTVLDYAQTYKYAGNIDLGFDYFREGFPDKLNSTNMRINWRHVQDPKSNPNWMFRANVNFSSANDPKKTAIAEFEQYLKNSFLSDVSLDRSFAGLPIRAGIKISARQSSSSKTTELTTPVVNFNMTQIFPFRKWVKSATGWRQVINRFGLTYDMEGKNKASLPDSLIAQRDFQGISNRYINGFNQRASAKTTLGLFKNALKINPSLNYSQSYNFQSSEYFDDSVFSESTGLYQYKLNTRILPKGGMAQSLDFTVNATTVVYSYYKAIGKNKPLIRHVFTPSIGYSFRPSLNASDVFLSQVTGDTTEYSRYLNSSYAAQLTRKQQLLTFSMNNTLEIKRKSDKDTLTGFKKIKLIDNFSISGNYDFEKDSMKLSNLSSNLRISPTNEISFQVHGEFSPYDWVDSTGVSTPKYALDTRKTLGRFLNLNLTTGYTFAPRKSLEKLSEVRSNLEKNWNADYQHFIEHPEDIISFEIPWKVTAAYNFGWNANQSISSFNNRKSYVVQTLQLNGDVSFTKRWKLTGTSNFDLQTAKFTYTQLTVLRDMHCWQLSFMWTPIAQVKYFAFQMNAKSSLFQDAKIRFNKAPFFL